MSKFGLTAAQRRTKPWGLSEDLLEPAKTITDPIHGDIYLCTLELLILDSPPMQRLRRIRQLGTTHLVYPGATHTRFSHSLGALRTAQNLLDAVIDHGTLSTSTPDLIQEWQSDEEGHRCLTEAIVLARTGALLHDMCHISYGHSIEDDLGLLIPHDKNEERFNLLWEELEKSLGKSLRLPDDKPVISNSFKDAVRPLILSKSEVNFGIGQRYPFVADIVGNTICADLIDYLQRDHHFTGLPARLGHRFIEGFYITRSDNPFRPKRMVVQISRDGRRRNDVVSEMLKYLRYRYELSERVIVHHAKVAADVMVGKLLELWLDYLQKSSADQEPLEVLEGQMVRFGDDGLLEHIRETVSVSRGNSASHDALVEFCNALLGRRLYKLIGHSRQISIADEIFGRYGSPESRRALEKEVATYVGLVHEWHVLVWVPSPEMKLKAADVLVDDSGRISKLSNMENVGLGSGQQIQEDHKSLWTFRIYVHPNVRRDKNVCNRILAFISDRLPGVEWSEYREQPEIGRLVADAAGEQLGLIVGQEKELAVEARQIAARGGGDDNFQEQVQRGS